MFRDGDFYSEESRHFKQAVWDFLDVSTSNVLFLSFFTDLGVTITLSICFSITKGERDVTAFSSCD